jgi:glyoxalase family protein
VQSLVAQVKFKRSFIGPILPRGHRGTAEVVATSFLIPNDSIEYWIDRFTNQKIKFDGPTKRFGDEKVITFQDPDGLSLELVAHESAKDRNENLWKGGSIPVKHAVRGFYSVTLSEVGSS